MTDEAILFACQQHSIMFENGQLSEVRSTSRHEYSDGFKGIKSVSGFQEPMSRSMQLNYIPVTAFS